MKQNLKNLSLGIVASALFGVSAWAASPDGKSLTVYCAAGLKKPVEAIAQKYRAETGVEVQLQYGGTGTLLANLRVAKKGDLFIAADDGSLADARKFEVIREVIPIARQHPVIAVIAGNPSNIHSLADLQRNGTRFAIANPESASIGRVVKSALGTNYEAFAARATVSKPTVMDLANDLKIGSVDAAIVWDSTVKSVPALEAVEVAEFSSRTENVSAAVLSFTEQSAAAIRFARFLAAPEKGGEVFRRVGFTPVPGDKWAAKPELIV